MRDPADLADPVAASPRDDTGSGRMAISTLRSRRIARRLARPGFVRIPDARPDTGQTPDSAAPRDPRASQRPQGHASAGLRERDLRGGMKELLTGSFAAELRKPDRRPAMQPGGEGPVATTGSSSFAPVEDV